MEFFKFILISCLVVGVIYGAPFDKDTKVLSEYGEHFEGDMILDPNQLMSILFPFNGRNGLIKENYKWRNNTVYFDIKKEDFTNEQFNYILRGLYEIEKATCIRFSPKNHLTEDYVYVTGNNAGCYSSVGRQGGEQILNLQPNDLEISCFRLATICHEFIHALGFYHQQSSSDRDLYVKIVEENISEGKISNFLKYNASVVTDFGISYDYGSVMHYGATAFSKNGEKTIIALDKTVEIGQRIEMSPKDIKKLNLMYSCKSYL